MLNMSYVVWPILGKTFFPSGNSQCCWFKVYKKMALDVGKNK
jgi:hypothetical protein